MIPLGSLRGKTVFWISLAAVSGLVTGGLWISTQDKWKTFLQQSENAGQLTYAALVHDAPLPEGVTLDPVPAPPTSGARITEASILTDPEPALGGARLLVQLHDPSLIYTLTDLPPSSTPAERLGAMTRKIARLCGNTTLYARVEGTGWRRVTAPDIWSCAAAPTDLRLPLGLGFVLLMVSLISRSTEVTGRLGRLARIFSSGQTDRLTMLPIEGPSELNEIASALNDSITKERETLEKRAEALSAISHDLGTPAARLKLRTAMIDDTDLRARMEGDIDKMIAMVEGVLSFTRTELDTEAPQQISLSALVEAIVDDYADLGRRVTLAPLKTDSPPVSYSLFNVAHSLQPAKSHSEPRTALREAERVLVVARPLALQRAITNLVENALNYGRRAALQIESGADTVSILVEDSGGSAIRADQMAELVSPFRRGHNATHAKGNGLGLSIVQTVARQHNGTLSFEEGSEGLIARLTLRRA